MKARRARLSDVSTMLAMDDVARIDIARRRWIRDVVRNRSAYVQVVRGELVAYGVLTWSFFKRPFIEMLYVAPEVRREGQGSELMAYLEAKVSKRGEVWTSTNRSNRPMRRLLEKRGFVLSGRVSGLDHCDPELFYVKRWPNKSLQTTRGDARRKSGSPLQTRAFSARV